MVSLCPVVIIFVAINAIPHNGIEMTVMVGCEKIFFVEIIIRQNEYNLLLVSDNFNKERIF